jgi:outer membrane protein TolC
MLSVFLGALLFAGELGFDAALAEADRVPDVQAERAAGEARTGLADDVSRLNYNPMLQLQPGVRRMQSGGRGGELYLTATQRFSLTGAGGARKDAVRAESQEDQAQLALARALARRRIAQAWLARWSAQQAVEAARAELLSARELSARSQRIFAAGESTRVDTAILDTWAAEAELSALASEGEAFDSGTQLSEALGAAERGAQGVSAELPRIDLPADFETRALVAASSNAPQVQLGVRAQASEAARLHEVHAVRGPSAAVGAMAWREGAGDLAGVLTLEVEIPVFERGERERAAGAAAVERARGRAQQAEVVERVRRVRLGHELHHTKAVADALEQRLLKAAETLASAQQRRLEAREGTAQDWVMARRQVLRAKLDTARAKAAHAFARFLVAEAREGRQP